MFSGGRERVHWKHMGLRNAENCRSVLILRGNSVIGVSKGNIGKMFMTAVLKKETELLLLHSFFLKIKKFLLSEQETFDLLFLIAKGVSETRANI